MAAGSWSGKCVLVTGAGGFIGSHLAERLTELGAETRAFVHYNALSNWGWLENSTFRKSMEVVAGDLQDRDSVRRAVVGREVVFHLGALIAIPYSYQAPLSYLRVNAEGTLNVLGAVRECGVSRMVHTSTSEVYGTARYAPIDEKHPLQGQSPYSASKIAADKLVESFHHSFGLPVVTVRPFNTFGPRQSARAVIPTIIGQLLAGPRVALGSTSPTRDMNFVRNTVAAFLAAASSDRAIGRTVHFGSGREIGIGDLARLIARLMARPIEIVQESDRLRPAGSEVERLVAANELAQSLLGWTPETSLEDGLTETIAWFRKHGANHFKAGFNV